MAKKTTKKQAKQTKAAQPRPAKRKKIMSLAQYEAEAAAERGQPAVEPQPEPTEPAPSKHKSALAAAAEVLAGAAEPMTTGKMMERMLTLGLWSTSGRTPSQTLYAAILREIRLKGDASRFRKADRGRFELNRAV